MCNGPRQFEAGVTMPSFGADWVGSNPNRLLLFYIVLVDHFRNNDQIRYFPFFSTFEFVFFWALEFSLQSSFTPSYSFIENQRPIYRNQHVRNIVATLLIVLNVSIILNYLKISLTCHIMMNWYWKCST